MTALYVLVAIAGGFVGLWLREHFRPEPDYRGLKLFEYHVYPKERYREGRE